MMFFYLERFVFLVNHGKYYTLGGKTILAASVSNKGNNESLWKRTHAN